MKLSVKNFRPGVNRKWFWLLIAFVIKLSFFIYFSWQQNISLTEPASRIIGQSTGDTWTYFDPIDNLIENGNYDPDFRMPGYGFVYLLPRIFLNRILALNITVLLQLIFSIISVYLLALSAFHIFKSSRYFYITFFIFLFSSYPSYYDVMLLTESFAVSSLIINLWFLVKFNITGKKKWLILSGIFICWSVFLRPILFLVLFAEAFFIFYNLYLINKLSFKNLAYSMLIFILPFIIIDSIWTMRNQNNGKKFVFLAQSVNYPWENRLNIALRDFISSWGGNAYYEHNSEIYWFENHQDMFKKSKEEIQNIRFPENIYTSEFNKDSLNYVKKMIVMSNDSLYSDKQRHLFRDIAVCKLNLYSNSIKEEKPFLYFIIAPSKLLFKFIFQSGSHFLFFKPFGDLTFLQKCVKITYSLLYWIITIFGIAGTMVLLRYYIKNYLIAIVSIIPLYIIIVHPVFIRFTEERFIIPAYPFLVISAVFIFEKLFSLIRKKSAETN